MKKSDRKEKIDKDIMETTKKKNIEKSNRKNVIPEQKPKSKIMQFREKYPEGIGYIVNMRAVLR